MKPRLAITLGDPAGIGPEIVSAALKNPRVKAACEPIVIGDPKKKVRLGRPSREGGRSAINSLRLALGLLEARQVKALVTAPVSKEAFHAAELAFPGHTEFLADAAGAKSVGMLMVAGELRALLLTRHLPLAAVSEALTVKVIAEGARLAQDFARRVLRKSRPRLALCGLNPHAGDNGLMGSEEKEIFVPAIAALRRQGVRVEGPVAADSVFRDMAKGTYTMALAAYHDQGMIPLKLYAPRRLVNITLGLPYIRTSPGHGTAYDIAGKGKADPSAMIEAILLAAHYSR
jgi:4-hydroxythreonine-4-phosphate dehydrogenase